MSRPTRLHRLIEERLDCSLAEYVAARRPDTSWQDLADEIHKATGIEVSDEALRLWFADRIVVETRAYVRDDAPASAA
jgi:hypothetical protein